MSDRLRGHAETIGERLERDLAALQKPLPAAVRCLREGARDRVSSLSLVRYRATTTRCRPAYGHREVLVRGYVHEVVIACGAEVIARHPRSYEREDFVFDPLHYLALLEQKINALDQAAPLAGWQLPEEFATLRRLLEARMGKRGKREFVQVLRLMEAFRIEDVAAAVARGDRARRDRLRCGQAPGAVPDRAAAAAARPDDLSLPAQGDGGDDLGALLHGPAGGSGVMSDTPQVLLAHHLKALQAADLPARVRQGRPAVRRRGRRPSPLSCCGWPSWS